MKEKQPHKQESTKTTGKGTIVDSVIFVELGHPFYLYALANELSHHAIGGNLIKGTVKVRSRRSSNESR